MAIIAVDCDEVLVNTLPHLIDLVKEKYGQYAHWEYETIHDYKLSNNEHLNVTLQESIELFAEYYNSPIAEHASPVEGAKEQLTLLKKAGHELIVVTARNEKVRDLTHQQLEKHYPKIFSDVIFAHHYTENHIPKSELCKNISASYLIEDNLSYALEVAEHGISSFVLERPWNRLREENHPNIHKITHRKEIIIE